ncbi:A-adding tRNA nucleotidyltransferase [Anaerolineae bacterium]|nr:A-adding tRNA nucleotidyltransferase [Anaerolineae bacterium]
MLVKEIMQSLVFTIPPEATLRQAAELMLEQGINGMPVVDNQGHVVGVIGLKDILRAPMPSLIRATVSRLTSEMDIAKYLDATQVGRVMATTVFSVKEDDPLMTAVAIMVNEGLHPLPVLRDENLVGVVSRADAVRAILESRSESTK